MLRSSRKLSSFHPFRSLQIDRPISPLIFLLLLFLLDSPSPGERIVPLDGHFRKFVRNCFTLLFISFYLHRCFYAFHEVSKRQFPFPFQCSSIVKNPINVVTESSPSPFLFIRSFLRPFFRRGGIGCLSSHIFFLFFFSEGWKPRLIWLLLSCIRFFHTFYVSSFIFRVCSNCTKLCIFIRFYPVFYWQRGTKDGRGKDK